MHAMKQKKIDTNASFWNMTSNFFVKPILGRFFNYKTRTKFFAKLIDVLTTANKLTSFGCLSCFIMFASSRNASGVMLPGLSVLIATSTLEFHIPKIDFLSEPNR